MNRHHLDLPTHFRVIDIEQMQLVAAPAKCRYYALSYVWGAHGQFQTTRENFPSLQKERGLTGAMADLSRTIRESIDAVASLGERYLWVDSLCIIQDDIEDKADQINQMHAVYSNAFATLIAVDGDSAHTGLHGVRAGSRKVRQHVETIQGRKFASADQHDDLEARRKSKWSTRAWTYQEELFSRRYIYITASKVTLECGTCTRSEEFVEENTRGVYNHSLLHLRNVSLDEREHQKVVKDNIETYTERQLSYLSDILNAFAGITSFWSTIANCNFSNGMALSMLDSWFLFWRPRYFSLRRQPAHTGGRTHIFASWSWVGWIGPIHFRGRIESQFFHGKTLVLNVPRYLSAPTVQPQEITSSTGDVSVMF